VLAAWASAVAIGAAFGRGWLELPDRWNPLAPLWPQEPPNVWTRWKLQRLAADPAACSAALKATTLAYAPLPDRPVAGGCGWNDAVRVEALPARLGAPVVLTCPAAVALAMWERHALQPSARSSLGTRVVGVTHFGSFACRDVAGTGAAEGGGRRSAHATADAIDIAGFALADGSAVTVAGDWPRGHDDRRGRFLRGARDGACGLWSVVLGPDYNAAHRDHFHLDMSSWMACL